VVGWRALLLLRFDRSANSGGYATNVIPVEVALVTPDGPGDPCELVGESDHSLIRVRLARASERPALKLGERLIRCVQTTGAV
jgi:hypothetical protein